MNAFWKTIFYGGILALWFQSSQCLPSFHHSQGDKEPKKMKNSVFLDAPSMDVDSEELYEELGESESDSESSSIVISEVPNFQEVLNQLPSPELNTQQDLEPMGNSRITTINSESKKLQSEEPSEIILFPKNHNPLRDFFQEHMESFFPKNTENEERKTYMTKIFSKTLENISSKERDDAIVFLIEKNISPKTIEKLFHVHQYMIEAFKICYPLDPQESHENRRAKAIELLKKNIPITKIPYIVHICIIDIKDIANKEGIVLKENKTKINYSSIPRDLLLELDRNIPLEEKQKRAIDLLAYNIPVYEIAKITHMSNNNIIKLAEKHGIAIRKNGRTFQAPDEIKEYMVEMPQDAPREEKEKRALILLEYKVPVKKIAKIVHMATFDIKKLAEKYGIAIRKTAKAFQAPDAIREYMVEMPKDAIREEKEKRVLILLEHKVPMEKIAQIVHMTNFNIKKFAEKNGISIQQDTKVFQVPDEIKEYMMEMPQNATREEKEKRALFLLDNKVPMISIAKILHVSFLKIKQLAEKHGIAIRKNGQNFQVPDEIKEYMVEMPQDATKEEKEKRALILLEHKVPMDKIISIAHMAHFNIKKLAEKNGISTRQGTRDFQVPDEIKEYMVEMPQDAPREEKEKRALILLEHKVPVIKIQEIAHMANFNIIKLAEKHGITIRKNIKSFQVPDKIKQYMVEMPKDTPREEKEKRVLFLLENKVPMIKIQEIIHMVTFDIKKLAEKHGIALRQNRQTFQTPYEIKEYMVEMPHDAPREEKEKRALILLEHKVPVRKIQEIIYMTNFNIKKLAEKHSITLRKTAKAFQVPDEIKEYMVEMPQDATREKKEKRVLFLLENKVPIIRIASIVHMAFFDIEKFAEKHGITHRKYVKTFQAPDEIEEYMVGMPHDAPREEKEKRALFLLENKVPLTKIGQIVHMDLFYIKKLAEKYGITTRQSEQAFQVPDEIKEYMVEMPKNATKEERGKRALFLLENKVPMQKICEIIHISRKVIKQLAEKYQITTRERKKS